MAAAEPTENRELRAYLTPAGAWAFALGTSVGWGSLVITCSTYLAQAGPLGTVLGLAAGALVMLVISRNYAYLMNRCPDAGGAYSFAKDAFGCDQGFLTAWFLALTYFAMFWANATSLPLFARYFLGEIFHFGRLYTLFGYEVYLGEALLSAAAILLSAYLCTKSRKLTAHLMTALVLFFTVGIAAVFAAAMAGHGGESFRFTPFFAREGQALSQVVRIACISPWAFIGFENISHASEEFAFPRTRLFRVLTAAVLSTTLVYVFVALLSVSAYPPQYPDWPSYIRDLGNLTGIEGLPAFYAARHYLGGAGVTIPMLSLLCLILTSLIGNMVALSRLFLALSRDRVIPARFAALNRYSVPGKAMGLIAGLSCLIPFLGRTAIGWIVDVTTIGATIIYGFVSASALKIAGKHGDRAEKAAGLAGLLLMIGFGAFLLLPNLFGKGSMETETYFLFTVWGIIGFLYFRGILKRDETRRFGRSIAAWTGLLLLMLFTALIWVIQATSQTAARAVGNVAEYYRRMEEYCIDEATFLNVQIDLVRRTSAGAVAVVFGLFAVALAVMLSNYSLMRRRAEETEEELTSVWDIANKDPLTGVKSKRAYQDTEKSLNEEISSGAREELALAVLDLNGLKHINDTLGHKAGEEYIRAAARMICDAWQHSPVFRTGGDEFVVILVGHDYAGREEILARFNRTAEENIGGGKPVVSAGMAEYRRGADLSLQTVFERADREMYRRKQELKAMGAITRS